MMATNLVASRVYIQVGGTAESLGNGLVDELEYCMAALMAELSVS